MSSRISKTVEQILAAQEQLFSFFNDSLWALRDPADPENADFVAGNPQEIVMPEFVEALQRATVPTGRSYYAYKFSEPEAQAAAAAGLRERRGVPFEDADIAMVDGAFAGLIVSIRVVCDPGDEVIFLSPPWFFYEALIVASDATPVPVKLKPPAFDLNVDGIAAAITERTRAVIVNSPHNPTGRIYTPEELSRLADVLAEASARNGRDIFLVSDEAYSRIVFDDRGFRSPTEFYPNSFLVYTYGKQLLTPGQRLGYVALPPQMPEREEMRRALMLAQLAMGGHGVPNAVMQYALVDLDPLNVDIKALQRRRDRVVEEMSAAGYEFLGKPEGTFYLLPKCPIEDDIEFTRRLAEEKVFVLPGNVVELPGTFRISLTGNDEMVERALPIMAEAAKG